MRWQPENAKTFVRGKDGYPDECVFEVCVLACPGIPALAWLCNSSSPSNLEALEGVGSLQETGISGAFKLLCQLWLHQKMRLRRKQCWWAVEETILLLCSYSFDLAASICLDFSKVLSCCVVTEIVISSVGYFGFWSIPVAAPSCAWGFSFKFMVFIQLLIVQISIIMERDYVHTQWLFLRGCLKCQELILLALCLSGASTFLHAAVLQSRHIKLPQRETVSAVPCLREWLFNRAEGSSMTLTN